MVQARVDVLGPVRLTVDGVEVALGGRRQRLVLALLVAAGGQQVAAERLVEDLWPDGAPPSAAGSLQVAVSRLRSILEPARTDAGTLLTRGAVGYALAGVLVDAADLTAAVQQVEGASAPRVLELAEPALALWRGTPYADLPDVAALAPEVERLQEERLRLLEARADALLALGRHHDARAMLAHLVTDHPFRERLWSMLALALYRCDRQAEALETLRRLRTTLVEELGVDPSASVRRLELDLLDQADHLAAPTSGAPLDASRRDVTDVAGRGELLATLEDRLDDLVDRGRGGVLLLTGEAGIGKTRLLEELLSRATTLGATTSVGRCHEADVAPAYWPWLPVLRDRAHGDLPPEVAVLLGDGDAGTPEAVDAGAAALRTYDGISRLLARSEVPLVVALEDLHWADVASLRLLAYAAEALRDRPVLLVATVRDVDPRAHPALTAALASLARLGATRVRVEPLGHEAVTDLLRGVLDEPTPDLVEVVLRRTDGNPFFVLELARLLATQGPVDARAAEDVEVPEGVADVLRLRVLGLSAPARAVLEAASVRGREIDPSAVSVLDVDGPGPVLDALDEAAVAGLVQPGPTAGGFRFVHALTRETVYGDLPPGRRARLHAEVGGVLADRLAGRPDLVTEVAHHHARAAAYLPELCVPAVRFGVLAAESAERRGAFDEALSLWTRTYELERRDPVPDRLRRHSLLLRLATARQRTGDMAGAQSALEEARGLARAAGDFVAVAEAVTSFRSGGIWHWREMGAEDPATVAALRECLKHVEDPGLQARLWANLGLEHYVAWRGEDAEECGRQALRIARAQPDLEVLRDCLSARAVSLWTPGSSTALEGCARELLGLPLSEEHRIAAHFHLAMALHHQGRGVEAETEMAEALAVARRIRHSAGDVPLAWWRWLRARETGDPSAPALAREALAVHRRTTVVGLTELTGLASIWSEPRGAPVPADVTASAEQHPYRPYAAAVAAALARSGDLRRALGVLGPAGPDHERDYATLFAWCMRVEVLSLAGDLSPPSELEEAVARITPYADEVATYGSVLSAGSTWHFVGLGLQALGWGPDAREAFSRAAEVNDRAGALPAREESRRRLALLDAVDGPDGGKATATAG